MEQTKIVRLTEEEFVGVIKESVMEILAENGVALNEDFFDNLKSGARAFFGKGPGDNNATSKAARTQSGGLNLKKRFDAAKTGFEMRKQGDEIGQVVQFLKDLVAKKELDPSFTIAQLIGGKLNGNKFGVLDAMKNNRSAQASRAINKIYPKVEKQAAPQA
jgi:hypothetical protein